MAKLIQQQINHRNDEYYTPAYAVEPLLKYLEPASTIWCPFDTEESQFVQVFQKAGHNVIATHISTGGDFFELDPPDCDYIISNPPYSSKVEIMERLFSYGIPFALLLSAPSLFDGVRRYDILKDAKFEIMVFDKRCAFTAGANG